MSQEQPNLRVRINQIDYTLQPPGALDNSTLPRVPVIRIYGESSVGKKACVHVHQAFPYFYLEYTDRMDPGHGAWYLFGVGHSFTRSPNSQPLHSTTESFFEPRNSYILTTQSSFFKLPVCPRNCPRQGNPFLWLPLVLLSIPQSAARRPRDLSTLCHLIAVWRDPQDSISRV